MVEDESGESMEPMEEVYLTDRQAFPTARFRHAGLLATADTCTSSKPITSKARNEPSAGS